MTRSVTRLWGVPIDRLTSENFLTRLEHFLRDGEQHIVLYANADCLNHAMWDRRYAKILQEADLLCADGMGVVWASRLTSEPLPERVNVGDLLEPVCRVAAERGYRVFFLGGGRGVSHRAATRLKKQFPGLCIAGVRHGYFSSEHEPQIIEEINRARPDILLVGMGVPKQEKWIWRHRQALHVPVIWGVGAAFDYCAGRLPRAPVWSRRIGLEWLFRLFIEPKRLWRRYLLGNALFVLRVCALPLADAGLVTLAWCGAYTIRVQLNQALGFPINAFTAYMKVVPLVVGLWLVVCCALGLYRRPTTMSVGQEVVRVAGATCLGMLVTIAVAFLLKEYDFGRSVVLLAAILMFGMLLCSRGLFRLLAWRGDRWGRGLRRAMVIGTGHLAHQVRQEVESWPTGYEIVGFVSDGGPEEVGRACIVGSVSDLGRMIREHDIQDVFVASTALSLHEGMNLLAELERWPVNFHVVSKELQPVCERLAIGTMGGLSVFDLPMIVPSRWYNTTKRLLDLTLSTISLLGLSPVLALIALVSTLELRGPALFTQLRIGKNGRPFRMYKFRTMFADAPAYEEAPNDLTDPRVTRFGRFLRRWSLDELPQLVNVLKGEMSLVGPRPEMPFLVKRYEPWQRRRHVVKPGLTGLWQVLGRKHLPLHQHIEYDLYYVRHRGWLLDAMLLLRTIPVVASRRGAF